MKAGQAGKLPARKQVELALHESEAQYSLLFNRMMDGFALCEVVCDDQGNALDYRFIQVNPAFEKLTGVPVSEVIGRCSGEIWENPSPEWTERCCKIGLDGGQILEERYFARFDRYYYGSLFQTRKGRFAMLFHDVTEEHLAQKYLRDTRDYLETLIQNTTAPIVVWDGELVIAFVNSAFEQLTHYSAADLIGQPAGMLFSSSMQASLEQTCCGENWLNLELPLLGRSGETLDTLWNTSTIKNEDGTINAVIAQGQDISALKKAENATRRQLDRLAALRDIDTAINTNLPLSEVLSIILDKAAEQLGADAATILLYEPHSQRLEYLVERGFSHPILESLHLSDSAAGRVVVSRSVVELHLPESERQFKRKGLSEAGFCCYLGVPLITKDVVKGVLEIFLRHAAPKDCDWRDYLATLAGQAAIAFENRELWRNAQENHNSLLLTYDDTIRGWAHALELRDVETQGHSQRVTDMTLVLGLRLGLRGEALINVHRGALLHDIGKMGIPDSILLKPGPLTEDEWKIMRRHPVYAYDLLLTIEFLKPALDIPYSHHERWDGQGYPRGLRGEEIPLPARIFSVVDVWDALRSDRPYRRGWPDEEVRAYLKAQAGVQFDPLIVEHFLNLGL
ncbi:MAG TPA: HD domain-containing phosphohydrolase [Anaerolineaceae bacterium]|nr:HD domain-containing phosphohydrolase [Anaerolineaceae bacterium]HPN51877.1 HD domain-containing phosphohydrolase [Anaerolineaceae bacterium]